MHLCEIKDCFWLKSVSSAHHHVTGFIEEETTGGLGFNRV